MLGPLTYLDAALLAIALLSGLLAMYRGLTREVLSILSWVAAAGAVLYFVLYHKPAAEELAKQFQHVPVRTVAQIVVGAIIFLIVLIIVHLITARISDSILDSRVGMIDRMLGFVSASCAASSDRHDPVHVLRGVLPRPEATSTPGCARPSSLPYVKGPDEPFRRILVRRRAVIADRAEDRAAGRARNAAVVNPPTGDGQGPEFVLYRSRLG